MIKKVLFWHLAFIVPVAAAIWHYFAMHQFLSFLFGSLVVFINTGLMMWGWSLVMIQKKGGKALWILSAKYLILIGLISVSGFISGLDTAFFLGGLSTFFIPLAGLSIIWWQSFRPKKSFEN